MNTKRPLVAFAMTALTFIAVAITAPALAACSSQPDNDVRYLQELDHDGLPTGFNAKGDYMKMGPDICKKIDQGEAPDSVILSLAQMVDKSTITGVNPVGNPLYPGNQSQALVYDAIDVYCPQHRGLIQPH